ncbi:transporter [Celerinatantimonas sp. YJH-8]|uniref:transporter n=1 Tax=Celerinatantimonas sp. YJH-8 TaxID=3228714 RepID=UPI0038BF7CBC
MKRFNGLIVILVLLIFTHRSGAASLVNNQTDSYKNNKHALSLSSAKIKKVGGIHSIGLVNMSNGMVLPAGKFVANVKYRYIHKDALYHGHTKQNGSYGGKYDRINQLFQFTAKAGLFKNVEARVMIPYWKKEVKRKPSNLSHPWDTDSNSGLGDVVVMGRYALMTQRGGDWLNLAIGAGLKLPTGEAGRKNGLPFSRRYQYLGPSAQLGTGSWDPKFEIGATKMFGRSRVDAHMMYTIANNGAHGSKQGNQFKYDLGYGYALNRHFDLELELNGIDKHRDTHAGVTDDATGGQTLFITPGIHFKYNKMNLALGIPVVIYRDINGTSATPERNSRYGLGEKFQVITRFGITF